MATVPTLQFANLGSTPGTPEVSVTGNPYVLIAEDSTTALVFDLRRYEVNPPIGEHEQKFKRVFDFEIPILSRSRLQLMKPTCKNGHRPFRETLDEVKQVYVVNLSGATPTIVGWRRLKWLFPNADISKVPLGRTNWKPILEENVGRNIIRSIESSGLVDRGEKIEIDPYTLFLFRSKTGGSASILVTGEAMGRQFAFFFGAGAFREFFRSEGSGSEGSFWRPDKIHILSAGTWHFFYPPFSLPVKLPQ